jgi:hypothetical protein
MKKFITTAIVTALLITLSPITHGADKNPYGTSTVDPAGPNEIIFTVSKGAKKVQFTTTRLLKLKSSVISIYEPFVKKRQVFTVVPIKNFFTLAGISGKDRVNTIALNDYIYSNTAEKFIAANAFIAIKLNGAPIPYDQGGPLRIIFGDKSSWSKQLDSWNWSLAAIEVK